MGGEMPMLAESVRYLRNAASCVFKGAGKAGTSDAESCKYSEEYATCLDNRLLMEEEFMSGVMFPAQAQPCG